MKSKEEIFARAVILFCLYERCGVEQDTFNGVKYTKAQREEHRKTIFRWLDLKKYIGYLTENEKYLFSLPVDHADKRAIIELSYQYESIRPLLWAIGMVDSLLDYSEYDEEAYNDILQIGAAHDRTKIVDKCSLRTRDEIIIETHKSMLWHWRAIESRSMIEQDIDLTLTKMFGIEIEDALKQIQFTQTTPKDFLVNVQPVYKLNGDSQWKLKTIALWRHHAFEWIVGEDDWESISADT